MFLLRTSAKANHPDFIQTCTKRCGRRERQTSKSSRKKKKKCNIRSISHSFCTSRRKQFHLKRLVVAASAVEQPDQQPAADWLIRSQRTGPLLLPLARFQPRRCVCVCVSSEGTSRITLQQQTPANVCRRDECAKTARGDNECFLFKSRMC